MIKTYNQRQLATLSGVTTQAITYRINKGHKEYIPVFFKTAASKNTKRGGAVRYMLLSQIVEYIEKIE